MVGHSHNPHAAPQALLANFKSSSQTFTSDTEHRGSFGADAFGFGSLSTSSASGIAPRDTLKAKAMKTTKQARMGTFSVPRRPEPTGKGKEREIIAPFDDNLRNGVHDEESSMIGYVGDTEAGHSINEGIRPHRSESELPDPTPSPPSTNHPVSANHSTAGNPSSVAVSIVLPTTPVPTLSTNFIVDIKDVAAASVGRTAEERRRWLLSDAMHRALPDQGRINISQVWRVERRVDGKDYFLHAIRPTNKRPNGLSTDITSLNFDTLFPACKCLTTGKNSLYLLGRHQQETNKHHARLRTHCLESLEKISERVHTGNKEIDGVYHGLTESKKEAVAEVRKDLAEKDIRKIRKKSVVTDVFVAKLMDNWDVLPDAVGAALGPDYFVFPEVFVHIRDATHIPENIPENIPKNKQWELAPPPRAVVEAVDISIATHDYLRYELAFN